MNLDFKEFPQVQDMITIVMKEKELSESGAIKYAVNKKMYDKIIKTGWASIAFSLWGHDDPDREWSSLDCPDVSVDFDDSSIDLINAIIAKKKVSAEVAVGYFLLFTMDLMGYHI